MTNEPLCLQPLFLPELDGIKAPKLYFQGPFEAAKSMLAQTLSTCGELHSNTYFNGFFVEKWLTKTTVKSIRFIMTIEAGAGVLSLSHQAKGGTHVLQKIEMDAEKARVYKLLVNIEDLQTGILFWSVNAVSTLVILEAGYYAETSPNREVRVGVVITAYRRDDAVRDAMQRFDNSGLRADGHRLYVVDNGGTLEGEEVFANANLGGAGGFTRGLLEIRENPALTHALFMDDDAPVHMNCIRKAICFLQFAIGADTAIAGAMLTTEAPYIQYGAGLQLKISAPTFLKENRDMTEIGNLLRNEAEDEIEIGGWFFFLFPVKSVTFLPFPFFVRGDDVLFSLQNGFDITTLTGVSCWQSAFEEKITPSTTYLAYRARFLNGCLTCGKSGNDIFDVFDEILAAVRSNLQCYRYAYAHAILDAVEDVLDGPDFFERNPSALKRLSEIKAEYSQAYPKPLDAEETARYAPIKFKYRLHSKLLRWLQVLTLDGHRFPEPGRHPALVQGLASRSGIELYGRSEILFWSEHSGVGISTARSIKQYRAVSARAKKIHGRFKMSGAQWIDEFKARLVFLQSEQFWREALSLECGDDERAQRQSLSTKGC